MPTVIWRATSVLPRLSDISKQFGYVIVVGISGAVYVDIAHVLSEVELIDLSNLMSDYSFLICTQSVPKIDSQSLY
jgi:hypothetical protein